MLHRVKALAINVLLKNKLRSPFLFISEERRGIKVVVTSDYWISPPKEKKRKMLSCAI